MSRTLPRSLLLATECTRSNVFCMKASGQLKRPGGLKHTEQGQRTRSGSRRCHLSQLTCSLECLRPFAFITATFIQPFITMCSLVVSRNPQREAAWKSATERARRQSPACFMLTSRCHVEYGGGEVQEDKGTPSLSLNGHSFTEIIYPWNKVKNIYC